MKSEPDPLILQTETMNFEEQNNSDIELLTEEILGFLRKNEVSA
ncbi:MAG: hypothetical protein ACW99A_19630 [Candidatus Kariarchaeaceae archaeon]|jgi:hypothetical protein